MILKRLFVISLTLFFSILSAHAQGKLQIDTITSYDVNLSTYMTTNGRVYMANEQVISKDKYEFYRKNWEDVKRCSPCEVKTLDGKNRLKHIAIQYGDCFIGPFKEYYSNGKLKVEGNFKGALDGNYSQLRLNGLCSQREGVWKYYTPEGRLDYLETYDSSGKVISTVLAKDTIQENNPRIMDRFKGLFKNKNKQ